jgi:hypothetical protein
MARLTKQQELEVTEHYYGIDPKSFEVVRVTYSRGGTMRATTGREHHYRGPYPAKEINIVFGFDDIKSVAALWFRSDLERKIQNKLEEKAESMRLEAEGGNN